MIRRGVCRYFSGTFVYYTVGILNDFKGVTYIALTDPLIRIIFQGILSPEFSVNDFKIRLLNSAPVDDLLIYEIIKGKFSVILHLRCECLFALWAPL